MIYSKILLSGQLKGFLFTHSNYEFVFFKMYVNIYLNKWWRLTGLVESRPNYATSTCFFTSNIFIISWYICIHRYIYLGLKKIKIGRIYTDIVSQVTLVPRETRAYRRTRGTVLRATSGFQAQPTSSPCLVTILASSSSLPSAVSKSTPCGSWRTPF